MKKRSQHPYKSGNFRGISKEWPLTACYDVEGKVPHELAGGMYVRNGGNPQKVESDALGELADDKEPFHWFDGTGALTGVLFDDTKLMDGRPLPMFVNKFVLTDVYVANKVSGRIKPILPSIATLISPIHYIHLIIFSIMRSFCIIILSLFTSTPIKRISVANTAILYHDGRVLATCESGPPMWVRLPSLDTVKWWGLETAEDTIGLRTKSGILGMMQEWTTAHPKRDPVSGELILFHSSFLPPHLHYSVVQSEDAEGSLLPSNHSRIKHAPVPIPSPRMMHDFGVSRTHTVFIDSPLSLDPLNLVRGLPVVSYAPSVPLKLGLMPRYDVESVQWYNAKSCMIFHTANTWSDEDETHMLCCRMNSSTLVYAAGNMVSPDKHLTHEEPETCQLYYYAMMHGSSNMVAYAFPLSVVPFEFPCVSPSQMMSRARYVYGCTMKSGNFSASLGRAAKIDCLVKFDATQLCEAGRKRGMGEKEKDPVDQRNVQEILLKQRKRQETGIDSECVRIFQFPALVYAQECSFVPRESARGEDDGYLLTYCFDESQLEEDGNARESSRSQLWIIDAWDFSTVLTKIKLPQRVPYGLHGNWFSRKELMKQRTG